jgi:regulatory protein
MVSRKANSSSDGSGSAGCGGDEAAGESRLGARKSNARPAVRPLDQAALHDLALSYVARFATTGAKLEAYLCRKLRERGTGEGSDGEAQIDTPAIVSRMIELGYVDDEAYARMRSRGLLERGFGARRIEQALWAAGVGENIRADHAPDDAGRRRAAAQLARKRRYGPYGRSADETAGQFPEQQRAREKAIAAMLRAGHEFAHARFICEAAEIADIEQWVAEAEYSGRDETGTDGIW